MASHLAATAGTLVTLTPDAANTSTPGFGSTVNGPLNDPFAYDCDDPVAVLPTLIYGGPVAYHGNQPDGVDVIVSYTMPVVTLADGETFVIDLYGRDGANDCCAERDDNLDIEFFAGGIGETLVATQMGLAIPNAAPYHLRVTYDGAPFDSFSIVAHDTDNPAGSYFTLQEIRAAVLIDPEDGDDDGLPDAWEVLHNLDPDDDGMVDPANGADGDPDDDGLSNLGEFENGADPRDADSDDDTLEDGAEVAGAGDRPPTEPDDADTDNDTLTDDVESNTGVFVSASDTGTDPTAVDTDLDSTDDATEVMRGSDPNDPNSGGNIAVGKPVGFFDAAGTATGAWGGLPVTGIVDGVLSTISHPLDQSSADYYCEIDLGEEIAIGFVELTGRGFRDACCPERLEDATLVILDAALNEVSRQILPGQIIMTQEVDYSAAPPVGRYVRVVNTSGADYGPQLGELAVFEFAGTISRFEITAMSFTPATGETSLTFNSAPGAEYSLFATSSAGEGLWEELNDAVQSGGAETIYEFTDSAGAGQPRRLYRLQRN